MPAWTGAAAARAAGPTPVTRWGSATRPRARVCAASAGPTPGDPLVRAAATRAAVARAASAVAADTHSSCGRGSSTACARCGAGPRTTWALVPPMPNELTPACPGPVHGAETAGSRNRDPSRRSAGFAGSACSVAGTARCATASTALISDATPAAELVWPMLPFTEPSRHGSPASPSTRRSAVTSTGSPSGVAVPCASTRPMSAGSSPATASASATTRAWPRTDGAVNPALSAPSLLTAVPCTTAWTMSSEASASDSLRSTTTPTPWVWTIPLPAAPKGRTCPSAEKIPPGTCT